jgi:trans-aconitate methyltransferase
MILQAGCTTADTDLGVGMLRAAGADIVVSLIDDDQPVTREALSMHQSLAGCVQGDLRTVPLPPRSHDIVLCALLLQRIEHAELVLDRLVAAIRPGGLLLLRFDDRDSAAGLLDRVLPTVARRAIWRKRRPGQPGPYPAVYERLSSARGVQAYALMRELVIAERRALGGLAGALAQPAGFLAAQKLIAWLSRGRLTAAHEELLYVLRKPEDRFARVL